jgi:hypothetical protein
MPFSQMTTQMIYGTAAKANEIKSDLAAVQTWCDVWKMKLNVEKCSVLHIGVSNPKTNYTIAGKILATVQQQKYLGVVLTSTLSWSEHVATTVGMSSEFRGSYTEKIFSACKRGKFR